MSPRNDAKKGRPLTEAHKKAISKDAGKRMNDFGRVYAARLLDRIIAQTNTQTADYEFFAGVLTVGDLEIVVERLRAGVRDEDLLKPLEEDRPPVSTV